MGYFRKILPDSETPNLPTAEAIKVILMYIPVRGAGGVLTSFYLTPSPPSCFMGYLAIQVPLCGRRGLRVRHFTSRQVRQVR